MINRDSTLYQIDNAIGELHYQILRVIDESTWKTSEQFISTTHSSLSDIRREFENRYGKFQYPSLVVVREPQLTTQAHNSINQETLTIQQGNQIYEVRPITVGYTLTIIDYRKKYIDEYYELLMMNLYKYSPRINVKVQVGTQENTEGVTEPVIVNNLTSISYDVDRVRINTVPSYDDKTTGQGQVYALTIPLNVDTQLIGNYYESKLIHQLIVNYEGMDSDPFKETDTIPTVPKT